MTDWTIIKKSSNCHSASWSHQPGVLIILMTGGDQTNNKCKHCQ